MEILTQLTFQEILEKIENEDLDDVYVKNGNELLDKLKGYKFDLFKLKNKKFYQAEEVETDEKKMIVSVKRYAELLDNEKKVKEFEKEYETSFEIIKEKMTELTEKIKFAFKDE